MSTVPQFDSVIPVKAESGPIGISVPTPDRPWYPTWWLTIFLGFVTLALYWPTVHDGYINYDDEDYVTSNQHVKSGLTLANIGWALTTSHAANWHPLTWVSLMTDVSLFGKHAGGMHFTNALLHSANVVLLFLLLRRLTGAVWRSAVVAAFFGWHPAHVESVAWVSERKDVLSTCLGFITLLFYARYAEQFDARRPVPGARRDFYCWPAYWLALFSFALGLMSKPMLVTLPFVMLLVDFWPLERWRRGFPGRLVVEKIPFLAMAAMASLATYLVQRYSGAVVPVGSLPLGERVGNALIAYCSYLGKLFWPVDLAIFYPHPGVWPIAKVLLALAFLVGVILLVLIQGRRYPFLLMGWLWYCGTLVPVIGLVQVGRQSMADRYTYIPSVGIAIMLVWGAFELAKGWRFGVAILSVLAAVALNVCLCLTQQQLGYWRNSEILFRHALAVTDGNFVAHYNLGATLANHGRTEEAIQEYLEAVRLQPNVASLRDNLGDVLIKIGQPDEALNQFRAAIRLMPEDVMAREGIGNALLEQGHTAAAIKELREGVRLETADDAGIVHYNLGIALKKAGQTNAATSEMEEAVRLDPEDANARFNLANILIEQGQPAAGISQFQTDLGLDPNDADAHYELGKALLDAGQPDAAISEFQAAFRLKKYAAEVYYNLGNLLAKKGQVDAAITQFQESVRLQPDDADAHNNLGNLLAKAGQTEAAISELQQALRLKPEDADTHYNLGCALLKTGQIDETISQFQAAIRLKPYFAPTHYNLAVAFDKKGQTDAAIGQFEEAIRLQPNYAIAYNSLGIALVTAGRIDEAVVQFQIALQIKPDYASAQNNLARALALKNQPPAGPSETPKP